jgi:hypothetical protein
MAKKDTPLFQKREFLNDDPTMSAFIIAVLEQFSFSKTKLNPSAWPTLDIADCSSKASLDFGFHNEQTMKQVQAKLKRLKGTVDGFVEAFDSEVKRFNAMKAEVVAKKKAPAKAKTPKNIIKVGH